MLFFVYCGDLSLYMRRGFGIETTWRKQHGLDMFSGMTTYSVTVCKGKMVDKATRGRKYGNGWKYCMMEGRDYVQLKYLISDR